MVLAQSTCPACGEESEPEARFCPFCGAAIPVGPIGAEALVGLELDGGYRLVERSYPDAFGIVFRGADASGAPVLVRVLHDVLARVHAFADRFEEAMAPVLSFSHPCVLRLLAAGRASHGPRPFLYTVTEPFDGRSLCSIVVGRGLLPVGQSILIGIQVLDALASAHRAGVLHLDLRPESILIGAGADGIVRPKVCDFGLGAAVSKAIGRLALGGSTLGTSLYASPERIRGEALDQRADVYSMGAILYEQLTGTAVFEGASSLEVARMHLERDPESLRLRAPDRTIDPVFEQIVLQSLTKDRLSRYASAVEMAAALVRARGPGPAESARPPSGPRRDSRMLPSTFHASASGMVRRSFAVGREEIIEAARARALSTVDEPASGRVLILLGHAGIGKSAVVEELVATLWGSPVAVVQLDGRCSVSSPLEPFAEAARDLLGVVRGAAAGDLAPVETFLQSRLELSEEDTARLLDRVSGRHSKVTASLDVVEHEEQAALRAFFGRVLATLPTVLVVEDADALDPASSELVFDLMQSTASSALSMIVTARSEPWPEWTAFHVKRLELGALDEACSRIVVRDRMGATAPDDAVEWAVRRAGGSPLLLELCAQAAAGDSPGGLGGWPGVAKDDSLHALVALCLRRAHTTARKWLECAALVGARAPIALLAEWAAPPATTPELLRACAATGFVRIEGPFLVFRNEGVRGRIAELVPEGTRRDAHRFIARWLSAGRPQRGSLEAIGACFLAGGEFELAAEHCFRAGENLAARGAPRAAAALFKRAMSARRQVHDDAGALRAGVSLVRALLDAGDTRGARDQMTRLEHLGVAEAPALEARVLARSARAEGDTELALRILSRVTVGRAPEIGLESSFDVESDLIELLVAAGRSNDAESHAAMAVQLAKTLSERAQGADDAPLVRLSKAAAKLARLRVASGRMGDAKAVLHEALEAATARDNDACAARLLATQAWVASREGRIDQAIELGDRALEHARRCGDRTASARIAANLGVWRTRAGDRDGARLHLELARRYARAMGWHKGTDLARNALRELDAPTAVA